MFSQPVTNLRNAYIKESYIELKNETVIMENNLS